MVNAWQSVTILKCIPSKYTRHLRNAFTNVSTSNSQLVHLSFGDVVLLLA